MKTGLCILTLLLTSLPLAQGIAQQAATPAQRLDQDIKYLASDELEGREPGSQGIETAATYIIDTWKEFGVESGTPDGSYRQKFEIRMGTVVNRDESSLVLSGPDGKKITLESTRQYQPMMTGGNGSVENAELVFAGYGISAEDYNYVDYRDLDVKGKVVVILRMEPQQNNANSVFDGTDNSTHASISGKIERAQQAGAAAILFVNDGLRTDGDDQADELAQPGQFGRVNNEAIPFFHVKRSVIDELLEVSPLVTPPGEELQSLSDIEAKIDENLEPLSQPFKGWKVSATASFTDNSVVTSNVIGVVEGEGPNADETILIGGHYDHLGYGGYGSNAPGRREIHNGADDNATGTAGIVELARRFAQSDRKPGRRLVFAAFSGEERGLLGSAYYVENPLFDLKKTVAMINYDMIGRLRDDKLTIFGTGTSDVFDSICDAANDPKSPLDLNKTPSPFAGSDHMAFVRKEIPVMFLHTGLTSIYHTPEDDYETLNIPGAVRVVDYTERLIRSLADAEAAPEYRAVERAPRRQRRPSYFGVRLDYEADERGPRIEEAPEGAPAADAGLQAGDVILSIDGTEIGDAEELTTFLRANRPGSAVEVRFVRDEEEKTLTVELGRTPRSGRPAARNQEKKSGDNKKGDG